MAGATQKTRGRRPDFGTISGLLLASGCILGGFFIEEGRAVYLVGLSAGLIVLGGCLGATLVANPFSLVKGAFRRLGHVFTETPEDRRDLIESIIRYATQARKQGIVSLENDLPKIQDPFLCKALTLAVDGADLQEIRSMLELETDVAEHEAELEAKVLESAGGYAPTIGIIGAVLGLIMVMRRLKEGPEKIGDGIATAFIATIYGVGIANLFFLPAAQKIKVRAQRESQRRELILEGVVSIVEGLNPKLIRTKLDAYDTGGPAPENGKKKRAATENELPEGVTDASQA